MFARSPYTDLQTQQKMILQDAVTHPGLVAITNPATGAAVGTTYKSPSSTASSVSSAVGGGASSIAQGAWSSLQGLSTYDYVFIAAIAIVVIVVVAVFI